MPRDKRGEKPEWYPLDNAGVLYSALQKEKYSAIYRFSAVMAERVDRDALQRAVDKTMPRFPSFGVRIKKGAFCRLPPPPHSCSALQSECYNLLQNSLNCLLFYQYPGM